MHRRDVSLEVVLPVGDVAALGAAEQLLAQGVVAHARQIEERVGRLGEGVGGGEVLRGGGGAEHLLQVREVVGCGCGGRGLLEPGDGEGGVRGGGRRGRGRRGQGRTQGRVLVL